MCFPPGRPGVLEADSITLLFGFVFVKKNAMMEHSVTGHFWLNIPFLLQAFSSESICVRLPFEVAG